MSDYINTALKNDMTSILMDIKSRYEALMEHCDKLENKIQELEDNPENSITELKKEIDNIYRRSLVVLSKNEKERCREFRHNHCESCHNGSHFKFDITFTGTNTIVKVECPICGEKLNLSEEA